MNNQLFAGIASYELLRRKHMQRFAALADGQKPHTLFLGCADSRVVPHLVLGADPGDVFVVRNVANLAPPAAVESADSVVAAVNFAVDVLGVKELVVCGHSSCGGVRAALTGGVADPHLARWLEPLRPVVTRWRQNGALDPSRPDVDQLSQCSALSQRDQLLQYPSVRRAHNEGWLRVHAMWFDIAEGRLLAYDEDARRFLPAVEVLNDTPITDLNVARARARAR